MSHHSSRRPSRRRAGAALLTCLALLAPACGGDDEPEPSPTSASPDTSASTGTADATSPPPLATGEGSSVVAQPRDGYVLVIREPADPVSDDRVARSGEGGAVATGATFLVPEVVDLRTVAFEVVADGDVAGRSASLELHQFAEPDDQAPAERVGGPDALLWEGTLPAVPEDEPTWVSFSIDPGTIVGPGTRYGVVLRLSGAGDATLALQHRSDDVEGDPGLQLDGSRWRLLPGPSTLVVDGEPA